MSSTVRHTLPEQETPALAAWVRFLRAHAAVTRALNAQLVHEHALTINDYEVLLVLARAPEGRMRRVDIAERVLLTASGITRLLDGLQAAGLVEKAACAKDGRVAYAVLTGAGRAKLREASRLHLAGIDEVFGSHFSEVELETLRELLGRIEGGPSGACGAEDAPAA